LLAVTTTIASTVSSRPQVHSGVQRRGHERVPQHCLSAIAFALEGNPADYDPSAEALTLDVTVAPAA